MLDRVPCSGVLVVTENCLPQLRHIHRIRLTRQGSSLPQQAGQAIMPPGHRRAVKLSVHLSSVGNLDLNSADSELVSSVGRPHGLALATPIGYQHLTQVQT